MSQGSFVAFRVDRQLFGVEARAVHDVFHPAAITPVPLAREDIVGVLNLRGRIVTAVCARRRLGLPPAPDDLETIAIGLDFAGDGYGLIVDSVEELVSIDVAGLRPPPSGLPPRWAGVVQGVSVLADELLIVVNAEHLLQPAASTAPEGVSPC